MLRARTSITSTFALVAFSGSIALAQLTGATQEAISVPIGTIFEIQAAAPKNAQTSWVLSENNDLIETSRDAVFRTRFSREGNYVLSAQVNIGSQKVERMFFVEVRQRKVEDRTAPTDALDIVSIDPPVYNNAIPVTTGRQVIRITPVRDDVKVLAIDLDTSEDSNDDGNSENDEDTRNTLFRSEGNPLHIWFVGATPRTIRLGALFTNGTTDFTPYEIGEREAGSSVEQVVDPVEESNIGTGQMRIMILKSDNGEVHFSLRLPIGEEKPLLLHWNFGDGSSSLLDRPIHDYAESGLYKVEVEVRDLKTGRVIEKVQEDVTVNRLKVDVDPDPDTDPVKEPKKKDKKKDGGSSILGIVIKLLFSLVGSAIVGALIFFIVGKVKKKGFSLEGAMEKAEQTMVKTPEESVQDAAPPMEIQAEEIPDPKGVPVGEPPQEEAAPVTPPVVEPVPTPEPEPVPEPVAPPPPPVAAEVPAPVEAPTPAPEAAPQPQTPSWLQEGIGENVAEAKPAQVDPPAPNVDHKALEPSAEQLKAEPANAPDWLQAGIEKAEEEGQTPATPVEPPKEVAPAPVAPPAEPAPAPAPAPTEPAATAKDPEALERDKERKRRKRQRYRENLKARKSEANADTPKQPDAAEPAAAAPAPAAPPVEDPNEPVAFITAEDIEPLDPPAAPPPPPPAQEPHKEEGEKPA